MKQGLKWIQNALIDKYKNTNNGHGELSGILLDESLRSEVIKFHQSFDEYAQTPLCSLEHLAKSLNISNIYVKDESHRFGLDSFKVLGGSYAIGKILAQKLDMDISGLSFDKLKDPHIQERLGDLTFATATDGNHGRGVAWASQQLGFHSEIFMPMGTTENRLNHILKIGANARVTDLNYDDSVRYMTDQAQKNNWEIIQDTAWEGYTDVPTWIMQGYATIMTEIIHQLKSDKPTHVFLQAGVGAFAAVMTSIVKDIYSEQPPVIVIVEPHQANCFYKSAKNKKLSTVHGHLDTIMAGLACGEPNPIAWDVLSRHAHCFISASDWVAAYGMRILGNPLCHDPKVVSGESGAITMGILYTVLQDQQYGELKEALGLNALSKVLLISTEGSTDADRYREIVWEGAYPNEK